MLFTSINVNFRTTSNSSTAAAPRESPSLIGGHTSRLMERLTYSEIGVSKSRLWELAVHDLAKTLAIENSSWTSVQQPDESWSTTISA
jgi:hypothetical protein